MPALSMAWNTLSNVNRCCGSIAFASGAEMLKNGASNAATSCVRKCAPWILNVPFVSDLGCQCASKLNRSEGAVSVHALRLLLSISQNFSGLSAPPGKLHAMPTMAIGSAACCEVIFSFVVVAGQWVRLIRHMMSLILMIDQHQCMYILPPLSQEFDTLLTPSVL